MPKTSAQREPIDKAQLSLLRHLLSSIVPGNGFYTPRLKAARLTGKLDDLDTFTRNLPLTEKHELAADQQAHPPYGTNLTDPLDQYTRFHQTSGTTGEPIRWLDTIESWQAVVDGWKHVYEAAGVTGEDRVFFAFSFGPFLGFWSAFEAAAQLGCLCLPGGGMSSAARLHMILDNGATVLCCTPTYALRLVEVARQHEIDLSASKVHTIIVAGEAGGSIPAVREKLSKAWHGARIFDHHGMTEVGPVTYEDPARPGILRVIESAFLAEVIDSETGQPVQPGQVGELILTTLTRLACPLLRYRTGDLVKPVYVTDEAGVDHLGFEGGILGRCDDMITVRGVNVYPAAIDQLLRAHDELAEYRVQVDQRATMTELSITVEPTAEADGDTLRKAVADDLRQALNLRIDVAAAEPGALPRFEMKAKRWVRHDD